MAKRFPSDKLDQYIVRFPDGMRDLLKSEAEKNGRSMNAEIITRLEASLAGATGGAGGIEQVFTHAIQALVSRQPAPPKKAIERLENARAAFHLVEANHLRNFVDMIHEIEADQKILGNDDSEPSGENLQSEIARLRAHARRLGFDLHLRVDAKDDDPGDRS